MNNFNQEEDYSFLKDLFTENFGENDCNQPKTNQTKTKEEISDGCFNENNILKKEEYLAIAQRYLLYTAISFLAKFTGKNEDIIVTIVACCAMDQINQLSQEELIEMIKTSVKGQDELYERYLNNFNEKKL